MPEGAAETLRLMGGIAGPSSERSTEQEPSIIRTAQLTIFYLGRVNIFDDVPADKAHAVMLLLSNDYDSISSCEDGQSPKPVQANAKPSCTTTFNRVDAVRSRSSTPPRPSPSASITQVEKKQQQLVVNRSRSQAELPFARTASLARFLEKRKDRVDAKRVTLNQTLKDEDRPCKKMNL